MASFLQPPLQDFAAKILWLIQSVSKFTKEDTKKM